MKPFQWMAVMQMTGEVQLITDNSDNRPVTTRLYSRRRVLESAAIGGLGLLGLTALGYVPGEARAEAQSMHGPAHERDDYDDDVTREMMRQLWEDHIVWTRGFIVSFVAGTPDLDATTTRLLRNQVDIGNAIKPVFGSAAGNQLTALLTDHILGAAQLLAAATAGEASAIEAATAAWYANGDDIAAFLAAANPRRWPLAGMQQMMKEHLDLTLEEAVAQLQGDWEGSIAAYDRVHIAILHMADMLADGLTRRGRG